jgi:cytoskeletal protein RodZ
MNTMADEQSKQTKDDGSKAVPPKGSSSNKTLIIVLVVVTILFVLPAIAFGIGAFWLSRGDNASNLTESLIEGATGSNVEIDSDNKSVEIKTDSGTYSAGGNQELPKDLPEAVVIYDSQTVLSMISENNADDGVVSWTFTAETSDAKDKVSSYFEQNFADKGWSLESSSTYGDVSTYSYTKDDLKALVTFSPGYQDESKLNISYYITRSTQ